MRTVVVTRPAEQAQSLMSELRQNGYAVVHVPLLQIQASPNLKEIQSQWTQLSHYAWVMFVSPNAVRYFFHHASSPWPLTTRAGSPGQGTTQALIAAGVPQHLIDEPHPHDGKDTEHLWQRIAHYPWENKHILLVRGQSRRAPRNWLMHQFQNAGAHVKPLVVYQRQAAIFSPDTQTWLQTDEARKACWIINSIEAFEALSGHNWENAVAIVIHPRIAHAVRAAGFSQVICTQPDISSIVESVGTVV